MADTDKIRLEVVTPEGEVFHQRVEYLIAPGEMGPTAILYNHAPLLAALDIGVLRYKKDGKESKIAVGKGFMDVKDNEVEILVQTAELAENIDEARAMEALKRAQQRLAEKTAEVDAQRAELAAKRATARLNALK